MRICTEVLSSKQGSELLTQGEVESKSEDLLTSKSFTPPWSLVCQVISACPNKPSHKEKSHLRLTVGPPDRRKADCAGWANRCVLQPHNFPIIRVRLFSTWRMRLLPALRTLISCDPVSPTRVKNECLGHRHYQCMCFLNWILRVSLWTNHEAKLGICTLMDRSKDYTRWPLGISSSSW